MLSIGEFARRAGVTVKALRHYQAVGVLAPAAVDPRTGYRRYGAEQLSEVQRVVALTALGFTLDEVRRLGPAGGPELTDALRRRRAGLATELACALDRLRRLDALRTLAAPGGEPLLPVVRPIAPLASFTLRARARPGVATDLFEEAEAWVGRRRARAGASPVLVLHGARDGDGDEVEACVPVHPGEIRGAGRLPGAAAAACVAFRGPYAPAAGLRAALERWARAAGLAPAGAAREVYHRFGADEVGYALPRHLVAARPEDFVTELQVPVVRA